jgi:NadR type nicotinamide-nucleotide adenylyltransferase
MKTYGLTLGKYAPFHRGHAHVVETMLSEVDRGIVVIYDSPLTPVPLRVRADWIRRLYPTASVLEAWDGPEGYATDRAYEIREENYIRSLLGRRKLTAFYSSEAYGAHMSRALACQDRRVDQERLTVPVSATMIREDPGRYREFIPDIVYWDLIVKVVFVGAMSTGKTTLARALAERYRTTWCEEYGRYHWAQYEKNRRLALSEFDAIAQKHLEWEEAAVRTASRYCFIDTCALTTCQYALDYHGRIPAKLAAIAAGNASRYDLFFLCEDDIPYDDTWDRSGASKREWFQRRIVSDLEARRLPYIPLRGTLAERVAQVEHVLSGFTPYANFYGHK